jgi:hypothetical protein
MILDHQGPQDGFVFVLRVISVFGETYGLDSIPRAWNHFSGMPTAGRMLIFTLFAFSRFVCSAILLPAQSTHPEHKTTLGETIILVSQQEIEHFSCPRQHVTPSHTLPSHLPSPFSEPEGWKKKDQHPIQPISLFLDFIDADDEFWRKIDEYGSERRCWYAGKG